MPKRIYNGKTIVEISSWLATIIFNEGFDAVLKVFEGIGVNIGRHAVNFAKLRNNIRLKSGQNVRKG